MEPRILSIAIASWLTALGAIVFMRLLNGSIRTDGLLSTQLGGGVSPERVQLLIASLIAAAVYAADSLSNPPIAGEPLRDVPDALLTAMAGSQLVYLGGKMMRQIKSGDDK